MSTPTFESVRIDLLAGIVGGVSAGVDASALPAGGLDGEVSGSAGVDPSGSSAAPVVSGKPTWDEFAKELSSTLDRAIAARPFAKICASGGCYDPSRKRRRRR